MRAGLTGALRNQPQFNSAAVFVYYKNGIDGRANRVMNLQEQLHGFLPSTFPTGSGKVDGEAW